MPVLPSYRNQSIDLLIFCANQLTGFYMRAKPAFNGLNYFKVNERRYFALLMFSGSIKRLFSIDCVNAYFFSINSFCQYLSFLNVFITRFCRVENCGVTPHCLYHDSLTLIGIISLQTFVSCKFRPKSFQVNVPSALLKKRLRHR